MSAQPRPIDANDLAALLNGASLIHGKAELRVMHTISHDSPERRCVMCGPSGTHSLLVEATDCARLNAHWSGFAADARNR